MPTRDETLQKVVESLETLSENDLQFIARIVQALGAQEPAPELTEFDRWAMELARRNKFDQLTEDEIADIVHEYRRKAALVNELHSFTASSRS